jgi:hypothetical protein
MLVEATAAKEGWTTENYLQLPAMLPFVKRPEFSISSAARRMHGKFSGAAIPRAVRCD